MNNEKPHYIEADDDGEQRGDKSVTTKKLGCPIPFREIIQPIEKVHEVSNELKECVLNHTCAMDRTIQHGDRLEECIGLVQSTKLIRSYMDEKLRSTSKGQHRSTKLCQNMIDFEVLQNLVLACRAMHSPSLQQERVDAASAINCGDGVDNCMLLKHLLEVLKNDDMASSFPGIFKA